MSDISYIVKTIPIINSFTHSSISQITTIQQTLTQTSFSSIQVGLPFVCRLSYPYCSCSQLFILSSLEREKMSGHAFFDRLMEKDRQKVHLLYEQRDKQNMNKQHIAISKSKKNKKIKTEASCLLGQKRVELNWYLDARMFQEREETDIKITGNWFSLDKHIVEFNKIIRKTEQQTAILNIVEQTGITSGNKEKQSIVIKIYPTFTQSLVETLLEYALPLLSLGKSTWSLAALTYNRRFDLLSLDAEGSILWKSKTTLSKVQLQRQQLMRRVFGFSIEKEKELEQHEILAKLQLHNNNVIYFILRDPAQNHSSCNAELLIEQEIIIDNIDKPTSFAFLQPNSQVFANEDLFREVLDRLEIKTRREEEMDKQERQLYLKTLILQLQGQLEGKQQQLMQLKTQQVMEGDFPIPSERIQMGSERYMHLKRTIKENKML